MKEDEDSNKAVQTVPEGGQKLAGWICTVFGRVIRFVGLVGVFLGTRMALSEEDVFATAVFAAFGVVGLLVGKGLALYGLMLRRKVVPEVYHSFPRWGVGYVLRGMGVGIAVAVGAALLIYISEEPKVESGIIALALVIIALGLAWGGRKVMRQGRVRR